MLLNQQTAGGGSQRNDEDYDFPSDIYLMRLDDVVEIPPKADDERKTPRLVFEFSVVEGPYQGKKCSTFVRKNLFAGAGGRGNASSLYKLLKSLGVADPMAGVDTNQLVGKFWRVGVKNEGNRAWPDSYYPANSPASGSGSRPAAPPPPPKPTAAPLPEPADDSRWQVWDSHSNSYVTMTGQDVRAYMAQQKCQPSGISLCPEGSQDVRTADLYGFTGIPF